MAGLLDRLDHMLSYHEMYGTWKALGETLTPAEVLKRNFWFCAVEDQSSFIQHERIGSDNILLEADYPHCDSTWPHTQRTIHEQISGLPGDDHPKGDVGERVPALPASSSGRGPSRSRRVLISAAQWEPILSVPFCITNQLAAS